MSWSDMPEEAKQGQFLAALEKCNGNFSEVRRNGEVYYVTVGNLFGSQTLRCENADAAWRAIHTIYNAAERKVKMEPPEGCTLMEENDGSSKG